MSTAIVIRVAGFDITTDILYESASFESQMAAIPGTFELTVKDDRRIYTFETGAEVTCDIGGTRLFGGYVTQVSQKFAFPVVDTTNLSKVTARQWVLRGVDYNILFDKLVLRNTADYYHHLGTFPADSQAGALLRAHLPSFLDVPAGFDLTTKVDDVVTPNPDAVGAWAEQGSPWRHQMDNFAQWGAVYYLDANKFLIFKGVEDTEAKWLFSDKPNKLPIPVGYGYKPTVGFREGEFTEDGTIIVNDALVWGGSEWSDGIVFARRENFASQSAHGRWQLAETHFGEYKIQRAVNERARVIVDGTVSGDSPHGTRGLVNPQQTAHLTWFDRNVPNDPNTGLRSFLRPGDTIDFIMYTLGVDAAHPLIFGLPLRSLRISFPGLDPQGLPQVQFEGTFGLQMSDPWWLWKFLRDRVKPSALVSTTAGSSGSFSYGTIGTFVPTPAPNGSTHIFSIPAGYISGTTELYKNGLRYFAPADYTETNPLTGEISIVVAPVSGDQLYIVARLLGS